MAHPSPAKPLLQPKAAARDRLIDAAEASLLSRGLAGTTMEEVARAAQVSRMTLYRHFPNKEELFLAVLLRDGERIVTKLRKHLARVEEVDTWIVEGMLFCIRELPKRPIHQMLFAPEAAGLTAAFTLSSKQLFGIGEAFVRPILEPARAQGLLRDELDTQDILEWIIRIVLSYLTVPGPKRRSQQATRELLRACFLPGILKDH